MVRPHAAVVTTVGPVHTENFPDGEAGSRAKAEVFEGWSGRVAVLNADNRGSVLKAEAERVGARSPSGPRGCDARLIDFRSRGYAQVRRS
jgi:UDP-N-acetylmuramoyl-tripeptide--D-alanyl-D-alanine ligase